MEKYGDGTALSSRPGLISSSTLTIRNKKAGGKKGIKYNHLIEKIL